MTSGHDQERMRIKIGLFYIADADPGKGLGNQWSIYLLM